MSNWRKVKLDTVADIKLSNVDKKTIAGERQIRLCNYTDVYKNSFINVDKSQNFMIASCNESEYEKFILRKGQVAITKDSETPNDIGVSTYISEDFKDVVLGYHLSLITPNTENLNGRFLHYWLNTKQSKRYFENNAGGSGQRCTLTLDSIKSIPLYLPNLQTQKSIAKVLSDIDAKIELNNRINRELEAMAKTLYDYWFVQFEFPVASTSSATGNCTMSGAEGYKSSGGKMVYNKELKREIPEGWEVKTLVDIANITMGQSPSGSSYNDNGYGEIFFQGSTDFGWRYPTIRQFTTKPSRRAKAGDILLSVRAPVGTLNIADNDCCIGRGLAALNSKSGFNSYLYYVMEYFKQIFDNRNNAGTTFGSITKDDLFSLKLVYPKDDILKKYNQSVYKYNQIILNNHKQNQQLTALRDWLLPMLMNGQVTVRQAHGNAVKEAEERLSSPAELSRSMAAEPGVEYN